jgi:hypothetical protein
MSEDKRFQHGEQIAKVFFVSGDCLKIDHVITRMEIVMEDGMHSGIPYVAVYHGDKLHQKFCCHALEGIEYPEQ